MVIYEKDPILDSISADLSREWLPLVAHSPIVNQCRSSSWINHIGRALADSEFNQEKIIIKTEATKLKHPAVGIDSNPRSDISKSSSGSLLDVN